MINRYVLALIAIVFTSSASARLFCYGDCAKREQLKAAKADGWHQEIGHVDAQGNFTATSWRHSEDEDGLLSMACDFNRKLTVQVKFPSSPIKRGTARFTYSNGIVVEVGVELRNDELYTVSTQESASLVFNRNLYQESVSIELYDMNGDALGEAEIYNIRLYKESLYESCVQAADIVYRRLHSHEPMKNFDDDT